MNFSAGYRALIERFVLEKIPLVHESWIGPKAKVVQHDDRIIETYTKQYDPGEDVVDQLVFALKYDGVHLEILRLILEKIEPDALEARLRQQPTSAPLRRLWFYYEWFFGKKLSCPKLSQGSYVELVLRDEQLVGFARNAPRQRVRNNLLGDTTLSPIVRLTSKLADCSERDKSLAARALSLVSDLDPALIARAIEYTHRSETRASFALESEQPPRARIERFVRALTEAHDCSPMTKERILGVQQALGLPEVATDWRTKQVWIGKSDSNFNEVVRLLHPSPTALHELMPAWLSLANSLSEPVLGAAVPPIAAAAIVSVLFVYLHPFVDGNGRAHRWLFHWVLARRGWGPAGVVMPFSMALLHDELGYQEVLNSCSRTIHERTEWEWVERAGVGSVELLHDHIELFRYLDLTRHVEASYEWMAVAIDSNFADEIRFLQHFDRAVNNMRLVHELPDREERLFIKLVVQNKYRLSSAKRKDLFAQLTDVQIIALEQAVQNAFQGVD